MAARTPPKPELQTLKILMLHGYTQSGPTFHAKTRALEKLLAKALAPANVSLSLIYPTAPTRLSTSQIPGHTPPASPGGASVRSSSSSHGSRSGSSSSDEDDENANDGDLIDSFGWYRHKVAGVHTALDKGIRSIASAIRQAGGVDGIMGFSMGAAVAAIVAAALEPGRKLSEEERHVAQCGGWVQDLRDANGGKALKFAVLYSGYKIQTPDLKWVYDEPIRTPAMVFLGTLDTVIEEGTTMALAERCEGSVMVRHPGGHHVPTARQWAMPVAAWIRDHKDDKV